MTVIEIPIRTYSLPNMRWHWAKKSKIAKVQRFVTFAEARAKGVIKAPPGKFRVICHRIGKRRLDSDNLAASFKHIQDGLAVAMGIDDGDPRIDWQYSQEIGKAYSVKITIEG